MPYLLCIQSIIEHADDIEYTSEEICSTIDRTIQKKEQYSKLLLIYQ